jgi:hypothetical protein
MGKVSASGDLPEYKECYYTDANSAYTDAAKDHASDHRIAL